MEFWSGQSATVAGGSGHVIKVKDFLPVKRGLEMSNAIPSAAGAADMALEPVGQRTGADVGNPQVSMHTIFNEGSIHAGVWECTPGGWPTENRGDTETASIVSGRGVITDADGTEQVLAPGAVVTLPAGWSGRWDITETLRKVFVIVS